MFGVPTTMPPTPSTGARWLHAALAGLRDNTTAEPERTMLLPLLIGAWKRMKTA
jgi:hypothetical protein